eukprot:GEMP01043234.1.p1 GENE.GEMP01043234.1~~GEMP01043234.1.p1  ORF type:complete len:247 (+),score=55.01 GEMP01043234.1:128-868(+)
MVLFFQCTDRRFLVYMGRDKHENEKLLANGFPEDLWFHADKYSSAHVYLRLPMEIWRELMIKAYPPHGIPNKSHAGIKSLTEADYRAHIPEDVIKEMCVLVKANSIEGSKASQVDIVWTPFANLKKDDSMDVGSVAFHRKEQTWYVKHVERERDILKVIEKTKEEREVNLEEEKSRREELERGFRKKLVSQMKEAERLEEKKCKEERELRSYARLDDDDKKQANDAWGEGYTGTLAECRAMEDDFM